MMPKTDNDAIDAGLVAGRLTAAGIVVPADAVGALAAYLGLLRRWGAVFNLTGIRGPDEMIERHLLESLALRPLLRGRRIADVGSGAGLPGIPLAITEPDRRFTLIESRAKRARFLRHVIATLKIANASVAHCRAEDLPIDAPFDTVLARAVAPPAELLRICRPLTAPGSRLLLLTAAHIGDSLRGLADDFVVLRHHEAPAAKLRSSIVVLQRTVV